MVLRGISQAFRGVCVRNTPLNQSRKLQVCFLSTSSSSNSSKVALDPNEFRLFPVSKVETLTHDTKRIVFDLPSKDHEMGLTVASGLFVRANVNGKTITRPYTPTNLNIEKGLIELVIKGYPKGNLSKHLANLQVGDQVEMKGPFIKLDYMPNMYKQIGMIAGGSGITPMYQMIKEILRNPQDKTKISLLFANVSEKDMMLREEIDTLSQQHPEQLKVSYVLDQVSPEWKGFTGYITLDMIKKTMPSVVLGQDILVCVCGPPGMFKLLSGLKNPDKTQGELTGLLKQLGYKSNQVLKV